jgi:GH3 auxin-responsive promoter
MSILLPIPNSLAKLLSLPTSDVRTQQIRVLKKLLRRAQYTEFGKAFDFESILLSKHPAKVFQQKVGLFNYDKMYEEWWRRTLDSEEDIAWPGKIKFYALSSGTSGAASKYIPITKELIKANTTTSLRQLATIATYQNVNISNVGRSWLLLGGSTELQKSDGYYAGDLSGIQQKNIPLWFRSLYKPGIKIAKERDWAKKLEEIVENAPDWDIGVIVGVPAWLQLCLEKIIEKYQVKNIHEIWPNLTIFVHGGVAFEPYRHGFEKLLGQPITYLETYLASEGFLAYQNRQDAIGMHLALNNNIFFEFVPFDENNFDDDGNMLNEVNALMIHEVKENVDYAVLISTNAGAWRYAIGDTVRFVDKDRSEIIISGRTKHFLSLVGEHLSVDNMNKAIEVCAEKLNLNIKEFTVIGVPEGDLFAHHWYISSDEHVDEISVKKCIDETLHLVNDDYGVERKHALKEVYVTILHPKVFLDFLVSKGKLGGQNKFPRVLKGAMKQDWLDYLSQNNF